MSAPGEHYAKVGPLWVEIEAAVQRFGGSGSDMAAQIDSLEGRIPSSTITSLHRLREQRNRLFHKGVPLSSPSDWQSGCERALSELSPSRPSGSSGSSMTAIKVIGFGFLGLAVLNSPKLEELLGIGLIGWIIVQVFKSSK